MKSPQAGVSTAEPEQWLTYDDALTLYKRGGFKGLGLQCEQGYVCVDLDHCVADGVLEPWAQELVDYLHSYTELSPSGTGVRVVLEGTAPRDLGWSEDRQVELYAGHSARFVTVTGKQLNGELTEFTPEKQAWLFDKYDSTSPEESDAEAEKASLAASQGAVPLVFGTGRKPRTKTITPDGKCLAEIHPERYFQFRPGYCDGIEPLYRLLERVSRKERLFLIRGRLTTYGETLAREKRPGRRLAHPKPDHPATLETAEDRLFVLDIDGAPIPDFDPQHPEPGIRWLLAQLGPEFETASAVVQLTSSQQVQVGSPARLRLYFILDTPMLLEHQKSWLAEAAAGHAELKIDPAIAHVAQVIYTASPMIQTKDGGTAADPMPQRWLLVRGETDTLGLEWDATVAGSVSIPVGNGSSSLRVTLAVDGEELNRINSPTGLHEQILSATLSLVRNRQGELSADEIEDLVYKKVKSLEKTVLAARKKEGRLSSGPLRQEIERAVEGAVTLLGPTLFGNTPPVVELQYDAEQGTNALGKAIKEILEGPPGRHLIAGAAGLGKTTQVLRQVIERNLRVDLYVPDHAHAEEVAEKIRHLGGTVHVLRGRTYKHDGHTFCRKSAVIESLEKRGAPTPTYQELCGTEKCPCPYRDGCPYINQFVDPLAARIVIRTHSHLATKPNELDKALEEILGSPQFNVVDESFIDNLVGEDEVRLAALNDADAFDLRDPEELPVLGEEGGVESPVNGTISDAILEAAREGKPVLGVLQDNFEEELELRLRVPSLSARHQLPLRPEDTMEDALMAVRDIGHSERVAMASVLQMLRAAVQSEYCNNVWIEDERLKVSWVAKASRLRRRGIGLLILDATPPRQALDAHFPRLNYHPIPVRRNVELIQVYDHTLSYGWLQKHSDRVQDIAGFAWCLDGGAVVPKAVTKQFEDLGVPHLTFGKLRGQNKLEACEVGIIVSRILTPAKAVESTARAIYWDRKLELPGAYTQRRVPYAGRRDGPSTEPWGHVDPLVQSMLESKLDHEVLQAIDRFRLIHNREPKRIFLITGQPIAGIRPDRICTLKDLLGPPGLMTLVAEQQGRLSLSHKAVEALRGGKGAKAWAMRVRQWAEKGRDAVVLKRVRRARKGRPGWELISANRDQSSINTNRDLIPIPAKRASEESSHVTDS
ncbi:MAG: hypothetical protein U5S82_19850 [Gammaproteobacteria bacterium]|nr:hypothetical protein [Gammaproteobacteria bacterium]